MSQIKLARWIKIVLTGLGICGLLLYGGVIPSLGQSFVDMYPELSGNYVPWLVFLLLTAIPCYLFLIFGWKIATNIGKDRSFCMDNARYLQTIAHLAAIDSGFFFVGNIVLWLADKSHPGVVLASLLVVFLGVAISVAAAALSHLVEKAAQLQDENDLTI